MAEYKGGAGDGMRQSMLEKKRLQMLDEFQRQRERITKESEVKIGAGKFITQKDQIENKLKENTIGLVTLGDFQRLRKKLEKEQQDELNSGAKEVKKKKKKAAPIKSKLSFDLDDEDDETSESHQIEDDATRSPSSSSHTASRESTPVQPRERLKRPLSSESRADSSDSSKVHLKKKTKDPNVDTSFLPDRDREEHERLEIESLKKKWLEEQEKIKQEPIVITFSFWDGSGHRSTVEVKKGDTIFKFLEKCRQSVDPIRGVHVDNLMYIKEDLIIPHHYSFYEFIINKTRGKSGPLFNFDVQEDVRFTSDASIETVESHAGKVCERAWYEKNKHIFPASRWEIFDPDKDYGKYSIKDTTKL